MIKTTRLILLAMAFAVWPQGFVRGETTLEKSFATPPQDARPWCYWYWMNGNVTREGIVADLQAMHDLGIGGVFLMDIGIHPAGPAAYQSVQWYELMKLAVSEAKRHGIQVSFHCPGWSASGGPWITPEMAMQELTWSEMHIDGSREISVSLPQPPSKLGFYRDIAVLAFPTRQGDDQSLRDLKPNVVDVDGRPAPGAAAAFDGDTNTTATLPPEFDLVFNRPIEARSLFIRAARANGGFQVKLQAWDDSRGAFRPLAEIRSNTSGPFSAQIGSTAFPLARSNKFRLQFQSRRAGERAIIEEMDLRGGYRDPQWVAKTGFATDHVTTDPKAEQPHSDDVIPLDQIVDLTKNLGSDGKLTWTPPKGRWTILRLGHTPTGIKIAPAPKGGEGLECDKMSREAADFHYDHFMTPLLKELGPDLRKGLACQHVDSYEAGWQNWTARFPEDFKARRGYDLTKYLPAVTGRIVGDMATTDKFLWDFRRTIGDLYADGHYGRLAERSHQDGLGFSTEPYGGPFEFVQVGARADFPMIEFWIPTNPEARKVAFHGVFAGHIAGRRIIGAESFTSGPPEERWNAHPFSLKAMGDYIWTCGVNRFVIHVSAHQPLVGEHLKPGLTCAGNGIHFDRCNTWFSQGRAWIQYLTRSQAFLQQGEHVADAIYFQGDDSPHWTGPFQPELPEGYDFDACGGETLSQLEVRDGRLALPHGKSYRYLVLPHDGRMTFRSLKSVSELLRAGATIVGCPAKQSPSLADVANHDAWNSLVTELWGESHSQQGQRNVGRGRLIWGRPFAAILAADHLPPDFVYDDEPGLVLHSVHRQIGPYDLYFVANGSHRSGEVNCRFRISDKTPELWHADTGSHEPAAIFDAEGATTRIPLRFDRAGSVFVVFGPNRPAAHAANLRRVVADDKPSGDVLRIVRATYGPSKDDARTRDVTQQLQAQIKDGTLRFRAFTSLVGDVAPFVRKELHVEYEIGGRRRTITVKDGESLRLPEPTETLDAELLGENNRLVLRSWKAGHYRVDLPLGEVRTVDVDSLAEPLSAKGPWNLSFPKGWGAPEQVTLEKLISWPEHADPGVKYFSGTAVYRTTIDIPPERFAAGQSLHLDLGDVQVIAEAKLNGRDLGILWKPPFRVDVTKTARPGRNELEVSVTNLWPNRLIGDEQYPDDCTPGGHWTSGGIPSWPDWLLKGKPRGEPRRLTFTALKHWTKDEPLLPSGLLGPVQIVTAVDHTVAATPIPAGTKERDLGNLPGGLTYQATPRPWGDTYLPKSAPPARQLQFVDVSQRKSAERIALACLQGLTSRKQPCIWLNASPIDRFWLDWHVSKHHVEGYSEVADWRLLFKQHAAAFQGIVIPDEKLYRGDLLAVNVAACEDLIVATPELARELSLPVKIDLRRRFTTYTDGLQWFLTTYRDRLNRHLCDYVYPPWLKTGAFAYSFQWRAPMVWIAGRADAAESGADVYRERQLLASIFATMVPNTAVIGFPAAADGVGPGEVGGVALASRYSHPLVCTNYLANACITSGVTISKLEQPRQPPAPKLERDKIYIALNLSDGDNQNCWLAFYKDRYFQHKRFGEFPLAFGMGPPIIDLQPARAQWYFEHAKGNTEFFPDVSGVGYMHPDRYGAAFTEPQLALDGFLDWTRRYMDRLGMRTLRPEQPSDETLASYARQIPAMHSTFADMGRYSHRTGIEQLTYTLPMGMPVFRAVTSWRYGKEGMLREIREQVGSVRPAFVNAFVHCWTFNDFQILSDIYDARDKDMVFVTPSQLAELYRNAEGGRGEMTIPITDANIQAGLSPYNWICTKDFISSSVCGASLKIGFKGTKQVAILVDSPMAPRKDPKRIPVMAWTVNGGPVHTYQFGLEEKSFILSAGVQDPVIDLYIKGMSPSERRWDSDVPVNSLKIVGFKVDDRAVTATATLPEKIWLNIGDSIMSGDGALQPEKGGRPRVWATTGDARASYGYLLAQHYGCREARLAFGGYNWAGGMAKVPALTTLIDQHTEKASRLSDGCLKPVPAVTLINLGANGVQPEAEIITALKKVRSRIGKECKLIVMVPTSGTAREVTTQAVNNYKQSEKDSLAYLVDLGKVSFATCDGLHPTTAGHRKIYESALPAFDAILKGN